MYCHFLLQNVSNPFTPRFLLRFFMCFKCIGSKSGDFDHRGILYVLDRRGLLTSMLYTHPFPHSTNLENYSKGQVVKSILVCNLLPFAPPFLLRFFICFKCIGSKSGDFDHQGFVIYTSLLSIHDKIWLNLSCPEAIFITNSYLSSSGASMSNSEQSKILLIK